LDAKKIEIVTSDQLVDSHVYVGEQYTIEQLWQAMLIASSNKAAVTLAEATGWTRDAFVERMNQKAIELGMVDTQFVEPTGLDPRNSSTGSDISILLNEAMKQESIVHEMQKKEVVIQTADTHQDRRIWNTNWLATGWVPHDFTLLGGTTGFIEASGYNVAVRLGHQDGRLLDIIILGANTHEARFIEARDVAEGVFGAYRWPEKY
jgi:D-alanyl-D-alanine carboxypeptidase